MKIQHWALIFIIIVLPFSIICRNTISKKNVLLRDETRINNIIDNATYDAVSQIVEVAEELGYGKNIPITEGVAQAALDRFFNTMSVNFNLPISREKSEEYFTPYIPAIVIVGYDGLYVYSCEEIGNEYKFVLKPKIPYAYTHQYTTSTGAKKNVTFNFTLDNYVTMYFHGNKETTNNDIFLMDAPQSSDGTLLDVDGTHVLSGYIGEMLDLDLNGIDDLNDYYDETTGIFSPSGDTQYVSNDDPYGINSMSEDSDKVYFVKNILPMFTDNLSYILKKWVDVSGINGCSASYLEFLYNDDANQDYEYDRFRNLVKDAGTFHTLRRTTIISLISSVLKEEFNEHNFYTKMLGVTYEFNLPEIAREQWNNTIDDISVLAFFQGMPIGVDSYYNNYSLGGTRIVQTSYLYAETLKDSSGNTHKIYHKEYCPCVPRDEYGSILYCDYDEYGNAILNKKVYLNPVINQYRTKVISGAKTRETTGIENIFVNSSHAKEEGYYICSECM